MHISVISQSPISSRIKRWPDELTLGSPTLLPSVCLPLSASSQQRCLPAPASSQQRGYNPNYFHFAAVQLLSPHPLSAPYKVLRLYSSIPLLLFDCTSQSTITPPEPLSVHHPNYFHHTTAYHYCCLTVHPSHTT